MGVYILFRPEGPTGTWVYFNLLFLIGLFQAIHDTLFYFRIIDKDLESKNSLFDVGVGFFFAISNAILIWGLSDKIYT